MCEQESLPDKFLMMETTISDFIPFSTYQPSKNWPFICHMCAYLVQITVVECNAQPPNDVNHFKMFYVVVIMLRGQQQVLLIKYNLNTMVGIYLCLQKVLHQKILVQHHRQISIHLHFHVHGMQYFTLFNLMIANRIPPLILHTAND